MKVAWVPACSGFTPPYHERQQCGMTDPLALFAITHAGLAEK